MPDFFICYSRDNELLITDYYETLIKLYSEHDFFFDKINFSVGYNWEIEAKKIIKDSKAILFFLSNASLNSPQCQLELQHAKDNDIKIIVIKITRDKALEYDDVPHWLKSLIDDNTYIDMLRDSEPKHAPLLTGINQFLKKYYNSTDHVVSPTIEKQPLKTNTNHNKTINTKELLSQIIHNLDVSQEFRNQAVMELIKTGSNNVLELLMTAMKSKAEQTYIPALMGLGILAQDQQQSGNLVDELIEIIKQPSTNSEIMRHRMLAATILGLVGEVSEEPLFELLNDSDAKGRELAAWTLGRINIQKYDKLLFETFIQETDEKVQLYIHVILRRLNIPNADKYFSDILDKYADYLDNSVTTDIFLNRRTVSKNHAAFSYNKHKSLILSNNYEEAIAGSVGFGMIGSIGSDEEIRLWVDDLCKLLEKDNGLYWVRVALVMGYWDSKTLVPILIDKISSETNDLVRAYLSEVLGEVGRDNINILIVSGNNIIKKSTREANQTWVLRSIVWALGWICDPASLSFLKACLMYPDFAVQAYADQAIRKIEDLN